MRNSAIIYILITTCLFLQCSPEENKPEQAPATYTIQTLPSAQLLKKHPIEVVVHRGANHLAPENTFASAVKAIELGVDYVEIDVHRSLDGVHYIHHDLMLGRTTDGWGPIRLRSSAYIDQLDAGSWFDPAFAGELVPRLDNFLRWIKGKAKVYLDVKTADLEKVVSLIRELDMEDETFFWFWSDSMLEEFQELAPELRVKINAHSPEEVREAKENYDAYIIECNVQEITPELVESCRTLNIRIMAYADSNTPEEFRAVIQSEADLVNLDRPSLYIEQLRILQDSLAAN
jgi:glycerophosphoryl diester phosphodiesterase